MLEQRARPERHSVPASSGTRHGPPVLRRNRAPPRRAGLRARVPPVKPFKEAELPGRPLYPGAHGAQSLMLQEAAQTFRELKERQPVVLEAAAMAEALAAGRPGAPARKGPLEVLAVEPTAEAPVVEVSGTPPKWAEGPPGGVLLTFSLGTTSTIAAAKSARAAVPQPPVHLPRPHPPAAPAEAAFPVERFLPMSRRNRAGAT